MANDLTPKQEKFCLKYIELGNATAAYYAAYDAEGSKPITANRKAKELLDNGKIAARLCELRAMHVERHIVTVDSITDELEESRKLATGDKQHNAAINASLGKAKLHGLLIEKVTGNVTVSLSPLPEQDKATLSDYAREEAH